ncbi:MAG: hypothetical protein ABSC94_30135 [Polyangiaceae bacterium]|jgi:hypothetical protein
MADEDDKPTTLADRIRAAHAVRQARANEEYSADLAVAAPLDNEGIRAHTVRRSTFGVEPQWLIRAKQLHHELGSYIYALTQGDRMHLPAEVMNRARAEVRAFVEAQPGQLQHDRLDITAFLAVVHMVATRDPSVAPPIEAGQPPAEAVCFAYSVLYDVDLAVRLADHVEDVDLLLQRWLDNTPRKPTKWSIASELWLKATCKEYSADTFRRWDPRKKQTLPGQPRKKAPTSSNRVHDRK